VFPGDSQRRSTPTLEEALQLVLGQSQPSCSTTSNAAGVCRSAAGNSGISQPTMTHSSGVPTQFMWSPMFMSPGLSLNPSVYLTRQSNTPLNPTHQSTAASAKPTSAAPARARGGRGKETELHDASATSLVHSRGLFQQTLTNHQLSMNSQHHRTMQEISDQAYKNPHSDNCADNNVSMIPSSRDQTVIGTGGVPAAPEPENAGQAGTIDRNPVAGNPSGIVSQNSSGSGEVRSQNGGRISPDSILSSDSLCATATGSTTEPHQTRFGVCASQGIQNLKTKASPTVNSNQNATDMVLLGSQRQQLRQFDRSRSPEARLTSRNPNIAAVSLNQESSKAGTTSDAANAVDSFDRNYPTAIDGIRNLGEAQRSSTVNSNADVKRPEARTSPAFNYPGVKNPETATKLVTTAGGSNPETTLSQPPIFDGMGNLETRISPGFHDVKNCLETSKTKSSDRVGSNPVDASSGSGVPSSITSGSSFFLHRTTSPNVAIVQPSVQPALPQFTTSTTTTTLDHQHDEYRISQSSVATTTTTMMMGQNLYEHMVTTTQPSPVVIPFPAAVTKVHEENNAFSCTTNNNKGFLIGTGRETKNRPTDPSTVISSYTDSKGFSTGTLGKSQQQESVVGFASGPVHALSFPNTMTVLSPENDSISFLPKPPPPSPKSHPQTFNGLVSGRTIFAVPPGSYAADSQIVGEFSSHDLVFPRRSSDQCPPTLDFPAMAGAADITYDEIPIDDTSSVSSVTSDIAAVPAATRSTTAAAAAVAVAPKSILKKHPVSCSATTTTTTSSGQFAAPSANHRVYSTAHG